MSWGLTNDMSESGFLYVLVEIIHIFTHLCINLNIMTSVITPGWWFGTFFIFYNIWDNPSH